MIIGILLFCLFFVARSGHIYPQDVRISPNNKSSRSQITLIFTLDTTIAPTDYLRIVFPFKLGSLQPGGWEEYVGCSLAGPDKLAVITASALASDVNAYFVQFYTDDTATTLSGLDGNVTYYLKITGTPDSSSQTGINLPIELSTVSNNQPYDWIVYDSNPAFGLVSLADTYTSAMTVSITIPTTEVNKLVLGATYRVLVDITPKITLKNRARIDISLTNTAFSLLSCQSIAAVAEKISQLTATYQALNSYTIRATVSQTLTAGNGAKYRFQCQVRNPTVAGTARFSVQTLYGYVESIAEVKIESVGLQASSTSGSGGSSGWDETTHQVQLGWGYPASSPTALNIFSLYKDASATERWYQSAKTIFKPSADLTTTLKLQVVVSTVNDAGFKLLAASIYHNLPDFSVTEKVTCSVITQGYLTCQNVGQLQAIAYFVSFKFNLLSTTTTTSVADFGKVSVQTQETSPVVLLSLSLTTLTNKAIATNVALYNTATNGIIAYSTVSGTDTTYVANGAAMTLNFAFKYFRNTIVPLSTILINKGIEFYTSQALATPSTTTQCNLRVGTNDFSAADVLISDCTVASLTTFTRLRFRIAQFNNIAAGSNAYNLFQATAQAGTAKFIGVQFSSSQFSSLSYVSENVFDYYARWVQDFTGPSAPIVTATGSSPFFFNSIVYSSGGLAGVYVGSTFFTTGDTAADPSNVGTYFPTLIRIKGQLTASESSAADRLVLFFNDLVPLDTTNPCFGPTGITCTYKENGIDNTQTDSMTDYSGSRQIIINTDLTTGFNIYIPVATIAQKKSIGFFLTTASLLSSDANAANLGIFSTMYSKRVAVATYTSITQTVNAVSGTTPKLNIPASTAMGATINPQITNVQAAYIPAAPNAAALIGAAYGYCANYNFATASGFYLQSFPASATATQKCVTMTYSPSLTKTVTCNICPADATMSTGSISTNAFTMPYLAGVDLYELTYVVGSNDGNFLNAAFDNQASVLTASSLTSLSMAFAPADIKKSSINIYATLTFEVALALPKKIQIHLTPAGSSTSLYMTPVTSVACEAPSVTLTSCSVSGSSTDIQIDAEAQDSVWASGSPHELQFMVDAITGFSGDQIVNYQVTIKVDGTTVLPAAGAIHHTTSAAQTFTIIDAAAEYIPLDNITYFFGNKNARTIITFGFQIPEDMIVYSQQQIRFNLGGIAPANSGETPVCVVRDFLTKEINNEFSNCDVSDLTQLTLIPKDAVSGSFILELGFIKVPSSAAPTGISCQIIAVDGATVVAESDPINSLTLPTAPDNSLIPTLNVNFQRLYADPGTVSEILLKIWPSVAPIALQSSLYLYFPNYYPGKLGYQNIWCTANDLPVSCFVIASRIMQLTSFPIDVDLTSSITLRIYGVVTPSISTLGKIFIGLDSDQDMFTLSEQLEISDVASNSVLPQPLWIDRVSVSTKLIRKQVDYTLVFTTDAIGIRANRIIAIDFPDRYGGILKGQEGPKIAISKTGSTVVTQVQSISFGSRFKITLPLNLDPLTSYTFVILEIDNPDYDTCGMDRPTIIVTDSTQVAASSRSVPNIWDTAGIDYVSDPSLKTLIWADEDGNPIDTLTLSIGIYSKVIKILPPSGENFVNDVTFSISQALISVLPSTLTAKRGSPYLSFRVGASSSSFPRIILLSFTKDESTTTTIYSELPKLELILTNNKQTIVAPPLRITKGGTSLPYQWRLDKLGMIPYSELKIVCSIYQATLSALTLPTASVLNFGSATPKQGFTFSLSTSADELNPPSFTLNLLGDDYFNYVFDNNTVEVEVLPEATTAPQLLSLVVTPNYGPTTQEFILETDQIAAVYWHVAYQDQLVTTDCLRVRMKYSSGTTSGSLYDSTSSNQAQYGVFYMYDENVATSQVIENLFSRQTYSYILCPSNQKDDMGSSTTGTFTTKNNFAVLNEVNIHFSAPINRNQLATLVCLFNSELQLPDLNVVAMDGTSCDAPSKFSSFDSFDYTIATIFVHGDLSSIFDSPTTQLLDDAVTSVQTQTPGDFLTAWNQALRATSLSSAYQSITLTAGPTYPTPVIDSGSVVTATTTNTTITLSGLKLSSGEGVFYAIASEDFTLVPTPLQIRSNLEASGDSVSGNNTLYSSNSVSINITDLTPNTNYTVYYYASNADRTQYAKVTSVLYIQTLTQPAQTVGAGKIEVQFFLTFVVALITWIY